MATWWTRRRGPLELPARAAYALWAPSYPPRPHTPLMEIEERGVLGLLPDPAGLRALDLGCGTGRYLRLLAERGAARVVGCDWSREMLSRAADSGQPLVCGDARHLPLASGSFDLVVCGLALGDVPELAQAIAEVARVLAPGGAVVYSDLHPGGALAGWKRTFRGPDGRTYAVRHHVHRREDHEAACGAAGLRLEAVLEPTVDVESPWRGHPAALVLRARREA